MKMKIPSGREISLSDTITLPPADYQPSKAEMEKEYRLEDALGFPVEELGETEEEQLETLARMILRPIEIKREK